MRSRITDGWPLGVGHREGWRAKGRLGSFWSVYCLAARVASSEAIPAPGANPTTTSAHVAEPAEAGAAEQLRR